MIGIIFLISNLMTFLIFWGTSTGLEKYKRGTLFGANFSEIHLQNESVQSTIAWYKRANKIWFWFFLITCFAVLIPTPYVSIIFAFFFIWLMLMIASRFWIFGKAFKSIRQIKVERGWFDPVRDADEEHWHGGMFYYNPDSSKLFTNKYLMGAGSTINMATKGGKIIMAITASFLILTIIPLFIMMLVDDFSAPSITLTESNLSIKSAIYKTYVSLEDITSVELIDSLKEGVKTNGTATDLYSRGKFYISDYGDVNLYVFREVKPMILVRIEGEKPLIFNAVTSEETLNYYEELLATIKKNSP